jgi:sugar transferase (PEP-CTERM system associated)
MYERLTGKILVDDLKPSWLIFSDGFVISRWTRFQKRAIDLALASAGIMLSAPLTLLTGLAIYLDSGGPILYCQERVGENGRTFTVFKFRSMRVDAEKGGTPVWASDQDDRITRVGRVIRKARLDELPQFWNVLRGDMSFVGPRPERPFFVEQLAREIPFYQQRHAVKPGLTGWAQVKYQYGSSVEDALEKLRYDLYYVKHVSLAFDVSIVFDTVKVILFGKGAK